MGVMLSRDSLGGGGGGASRSRAAESQINRRLPRKRGGRAKTELWVTW